MANIYMSWSELLTKHTTEGLEFKYHDFEHRTQIYLIDGADAYILYLPTQATLNSPNFIADDKVALQAQLDDWTNNHRAEATATEGVND